jgi:hypothetical protein
MERDRAAKSTRKYLQLAKDDAPEVDREALPRTGGWADCGESVEEHMTSALREGIGTTFTISQT